MVAVQSRLVVGPEELVAAGDHDQYSPPMHISGEVAKPGVEPTP